MCDHLAMSARRFDAATARLKDAAQRTPEGARRHLLSVQSQLEAIARGDFEAVLAQAADDVTLDIFAPMEFPWIRHARGVSELRAAMQQNFSAVEDQQPEITNVHTETNAVVLFGRERGRLVATGQAYDLEFVERFTFRDERLAAVRIIAAHAHA
jgi:ketosteroid isomerase-like protein